MLRAIDAFVELTKEQEITIDERMKHFEKLFAINDSSLIEFFKKEPKLLLILLFDSLHSAENFAFYSTVLERLFKKIKIETHLKDLKIIETNLIKLVQIAINYLEKDNIESSVAVLIVLEYILKIFHKKFLNHESLYDICEAFVPAFKSLNDIVLTTALQVWQSVIHSSTYILFYSNTKIENKKFRTHVIFLTKPMVSIKMRTQQYICDEMFETWWVLTKSICNILYDYIEEIVIPFIMYTIGCKPSSMEKKLLNNNNWYDDYNIEDVRYTSTVIFFISDKKNAQAEFIHFPTLTIKAYLLLKNFLSPDGEFSYAFYSINKQPIYNCAVSLIQLIRLLTFRALNLGENERIKTYENIPILWYYIANLIQKKLNFDERTKQFKVFQRQLQKFCFEFSTETELCKNTIEAILKVNGDYDQELLLAMIHQLLSSNCSTPTSISNSSDNQNYFEKANNITDNVNDEIFSTLKFKNKQMTYFPNSCSFYESGNSTPKRRKYLFINNNNDSNLIKKNLFPIENNEIINNENLLKCVKNECLTPSILKKVNSSLNNLSQRSNRHVHFDSNNLNESMDEKKITIHKNFKRTNNVWLDVSRRIESPTNYLLNNSPINLKRSYESIDKLIPLEKIETLSDSFTLDKVNSIVDSQRTLLSISKTKRKKIFNNTNINFGPKFEKILRSITEPIMPEYVNSDDPINIKICQILSPLSSHILQQQFKLKNITTVGDFARLTESEITEFFIKPPNRIRRAKTMIRKYFLGKDFSSSTKNTLNKKMIDETGDVIDLNDDIINNAVELSPKKFNDCYLTQTQNFYGIEPEDDSLDAEGINTNLNTLNLVEKIEPINSDENVCSTTETVSQQTETDENIYSLNNGEFVVSKFSNLLNSITSTDFEKLEPAQLSELCTILSIKLSEAIKAWKSFT